MASSTTRTTHLELTILRHYRNVHIFLSRSGYSYELSVLEDALGKVLDCPVGEIEEVLLPVHKKRDAASVLCRGGGVAGWKGVKEMREGRQQWEATVAVARGKKRSWCVWEAGGECMSIGDALGAKGRGEEGVGWLELGAELRELAESEWMREQEVEKLAKEARERERVEMREWEGVGE